ncbi:hypothetical protein [Klebsiella pasteurii]|uniref:hypothetical protein n=1 Tax=Klebsiella pasteurii TaxID=2587529 RepID=UPI00237B4E25|nr:hypothetical protein [Klebsiella pasteurii]MDD9662556.1 hypothetical protein [Klebsiella pasteurii]MDD9670200.1 hypothetical protein [Klebsiella pasteurii]MDD9685522.1 hypothetical protein [Klebsiella pasteurii]
MLRQTDINQAFRKLVLHNSKGYQYLHTRDFVSSLQQRGIHFSHSDANRWIERYQSCFADKTPDHTENRLWILRNMGRVM